ncbi:MAG: hypothetical protein ACRD3O_10550 [Terriglobia bacterium]
MNSQASRLKIGSTNQPHRNFVARAAFELLYQIDACTIVQPSAMPSVAKKAAVA